MSRVCQTDYLTVRQTMKWLVAHRPYFKQHHTIAPDIIGCGVLLVEQSLKREWSNLFFNHYMPPCPARLSFPSFLSLSLQLNCPYLWGGPLHRNLASTGLVICIIYQIPCQSKISNLEWNENHVFVFLDWNEKHTSQAL